MRKRDTRSRSATTWQVQGQADALRTEAGLLVAALTAHPVAASVRGATDFRHRLDFAETPADVLELVDWLTFALLDPRMRDLAPQLFRWARSLRGRQLRLERVVCPPALRLVRGGKAA